MSGVPQGMIMGPIFFKIFCSDPDNGTEWTLNKFTGDIKLKGVADRLYNCSAIQGDPDRPEECAGKNLTKFENGKGQGPHLAKSNSGHQYSLVADWLKNSFIEKDSVFLVDKLTMSQQYTFTAVKAKCIMVCFKKIIDSSLKV